MKSTFPRNRQFKEATTTTTTTTTTTGRQGHEETVQRSEVSVSEVEEASAERGTEESRALSEAGLTVRMETDCSSSGTLPQEESAADQRNTRKDSGGTVPQPQGTPQKVALLPSFFVAPICTEMHGSPPYRVIPLKKEFTKPVLGQTPKKANNPAGVEVYTILENHKCVPQGTPTLPMRPKCGTQKPRSPRKGKTNAASSSPRVQRPSTEPPPGPRPPRPGTEPSPGKSVENLAVESAGGRGEVKEKLVYVVEEKGKNVTKVETDLFTLNEILTIKKDLLELSEFAKKLKQLKERNKPQENIKAEDGTCRCEHPSEILKDVNKRIEALEMRQEELEKVSGRKSIQKEELAVKRVTTPSSTVRETARPTVNAVVPTQSRVNATDTRRGPPGLSNAADLVNELLDIKEQLKRLEDRRSPKPELEELPVEKVNPKKKDGAIAVFSSKTYIFSPDKVGGKEKESKGTENKAFGDKVGFEEARIINWLKGVCSGGSDFKVVLKPSPTIVEESMPEGKVEFTCKNCCGPLEETGALGNQEPQKNRATQKNSRQDDFLKNGPPSAKMLNKRSYKECFVSPSGRFFAWMKRSSDKVMRNFCSEWPQTKVLRKVQPRQISRTTSTGSIASLPRDSPPRGVRCPVLSEVTLSGTLPDFLGVFCKTEKTALNENMKCIGRAGRRSLSRDKLQKEDKNQAVRRRDPHRPRPKKDSELSLSSSLSEIIDSMDFDANSNSVGGSRWQTSNQFHAQVFSCFAQPDYMMDTSQGNQWIRETDKQRKKREKKERKAANRIQKKTAKMQKRCEKRKRKLVKNQEKYDSRCIVEDCDFGKDYWKKQSPKQRQQAMVEDRRQMFGEPYRPNVYKRPERQEYPDVKQPYVSPRYSNQDCFDDQRFRQEEPDEESCETGTSSEGSGDHGKRQTERTKSVLSAERPSFERNMLRDFFRSFGWLYPRLGEICGEYPDRKKIDLEEREIREVRRKREKDECPEDEYDRGSRTSLSSLREADRPQRKPPPQHHNHDPDHVENCDCVRLYLQAQVEKKLAAIRKNHLSSTESLCTDTSKSDFERQKRHGRQPKWDESKRERIKQEGRWPGAEIQKNRELKHRKHQGGVPKPEQEIRHDSRTRLHHPPMPERHNKAYYTTRKDETMDHPMRSEKKVRHQGEDNERFCQYCGTSPCLVGGKHDIRKHEGSSGSTPQEECAPLRGPPRREVYPRKEQCPPHSRSPHEHIPFLSYLCQLWRSRNHQPSSPPPERRVYSPGRQDSKTSINKPPEAERRRGRDKPVCSRCAIKRRNLDYSRPWLLEVRETPPEICHYKEECPEYNRNGGRHSPRTSPRMSPRMSPRTSPRISPKVSPRMLDHPPTQAHCFLINDDSDNFVTKTNLVCFPEDSPGQRRCRPKNRAQEEEDYRRDKAIECHFMRESQDMTDKTTETEDLSTSTEKINKRNLKNRLVSLHCLWKNLRKCTLQKAMIGREVGKSIRRSISRLDTYDYWWSDTWPKRRRHRHCKRRFHRR